MNATCYAERPTRTPHSGYHFDGSSRRFFEGWYFKVSIPDSKQSFAWMYSAEDQGVAGREWRHLDESAPSMPLGGLFDGPRFPGVGAQVMGGEEYLWQFDPDVEGFWADKRELALGYTFKAKGLSTAPKGLLPAREFEVRVAEGFQVSPTWHQGVLRDNGRTPGARAVPEVRWEYSTTPVYGWGDVGAAQKATAGWLAALPVFEPHWQICMAGGLSTGWIQWGDRRFEFEDAPSYVEKNWGGSFPQKWFWIQCNTVVDGTRPLALTAGGGRRGLPLVPGSSEEVAMVGIHYGGRFYEFVPWEGTVSWDIAPWGSWRMTAQTRDYEVTLEASTEDEGTVLRAPTGERGLAPMCKDTFAGNLKIVLRSRLPDGGAGQVIVETTSDMAALEVGGGPWWDNWRNSARSPEPLRQILGLPIDPGSLTKNLPSAFQLPGL